jgi:hypothetical protein
MKAIVYEAVSFPAYAVCHFVNGDPLNNTLDNLEMIDWEVQLHTDIITEGCHFVDIVFGDDEFFSNRPVFGLPCTCVEATIYIERD